MEPLLYQIPMLRHYGYCPHRRHRLSYVCVALIVRSLTRHHHNHRFCSGKHLALMIMFRRDPANLYILCEMKE